MSPTVAIAAQPTAAVTVKVPDESRNNASATAIAGEDVTIRTLFIAWEIKKVFFTPRITWGDKDSEPRARYERCGMNGRSCSPLSRVCLVGLIH